MWQGLAILFGLSLLTLILITLLTKPEDKEVLRTFYKRCRPPGIWGAVRIGQKERQRAKGKGVWLLIPGWEFFVVWDWFWRLMPCLQWPMECSF